MPPGKRAERDATANEDVPTSKKVDAGAKASSTNADDAPKGKVNSTATKNCDHFVGLPKGYEYDQQKDEEQGKGVRARTGPYCVYISVNMM